MAMIPQTGWSGFSNSSKARPKTALTSLLHAQAMRIKSAPYESSRYFVSDVGWQGEGSVAILHIPSLFVHGDTDGTFDEHTLPRSQRPRVKETLKASFDTSPTLFDTLEGATEAVNQALAEVILNAHEVTKTHMTSSMKSKAERRNDGPGDKDFDQSAQSTMTSKDGSKSVTIVFGALPKARTEADVSAVTQWFRDRKEGVKAWMDGLGAHEPTTQYEILDD